MSRWFLGACPSDGLDRVIMGLIENMAAKPCPTRREIMDHTGMSRRRIWGYLNGMQVRGLIEVEVIETKDCGKDPKRRRMRVLPKGKWTDWTARVRALPGPAPKKIPRGQAYGARIGCAILNDATALAVFSAEGRQDIIGERYGVARNTVSAVKCRRTWRHIHEAE